MTDEPSISTSIAAWLRRKATDLRRALSVRMSRESREIVDMHEVRV